MSPPLISAERGGTPSDKIEWANCLKAGIEARLKLIRSFRESKSAVVKSQSHSMPQTQSVPYAFDLKNRPTCLKTLMFFLPS